MASPSLALRIQWQTAPETQQQIAKALRNPLLALAAAAAREVLLLARGL